MRISICRVIALLAVGTSPAVRADQDATPAYTAKLVQLPRAARYDIVQGDDLLNRRATRILRGRKAVLDIWLPSRVPPPDGLFDGMLLAILAPPRRPRPDKMVTVRTMEKGMKVGFSTVEREGAHRTILKLRQSLRTWPRLNAARPLALVGPEEPIWLGLPLEGPRAVLHEEAGELHLILALQPDQKRGVRWELPPRIRKILGL